MPKISHAQWGRDGTGIPTPSPRIGDRAGKDQSRKGLKPAVELGEIALDLSNPDRKVRIGKGLAKDLSEKVIQVLRKYARVFAWGPEDMPRVNRSVIMHRLVVDPAYRPVKQKCRHLSAERRQKNGDGVGRGGVSPSPSPTPESFPHPCPRFKRGRGSSAGMRHIVIPTWRICVDYTDLNKACPQDPFPLPRTDQLVDEIGQCELHSFMDAFKEYH
nr:protein NYNRIN-like [Ipomoea batatas]